MNQTKKNYRTQLFLLILISAIARCFLAYSIELGNDEVYYRLYALFPDWSHFDHPLMVGLVMQIFSFNMLFQSELMLRLSAIVFGSLNIWIIYRTGCLVKDERTGFIAAVLYVSSVYSTVITGIFILPDTPQAFFWIWSIYLMLKVLPKGHESNTMNYEMLLLGLTLGLGILSKYTTIYLWAGTGMYILFFRREWFRKRSLYLSLLITFICILPILVWNCQNDFISFTFHSSRVDLEGYALNFNTFLREFLGEAFYNNPVNFVLILLVIIPVFKNSLNVKKSVEAIVVLSSLPLIISFLIFSLFRETLPHWSATAYTSMLILVAIWLSQFKNVRLMRGLLVSSVSFLVLTLALGYFQINFGVFNLSGNEDPNRLGKNDFSLDMYGYKQVGEGFAEIVENDLNTGKMPDNSVLIGDNWFPLANYQYYAAHPIGMKVYGISDLHHLHKYAWTNKIQGGFALGMSGYYLTDSKYYRVPNELIRSCFETIETADTISVYRNGKLVKNAYVFRLKNMVKIPDDPLGEIN